MRVVWSPLSLDRVEMIARGIAADRPAGAERWVRSVFARIAQLRRYPDSARMVPEFGREDVRQVPHPPYRIIHRVEAKRVLVLTVRHGREELDPADILDSEQP